jgi:hypothetical protein
VKHERQRFRVPGDNAELGKKARLCEPNQHCSRHASCPAACPPSLQDAQAQTTDRAVWNTNHVPVLRIDHISIEGILYGVWQVLHASCIQREENEPTPCSPSVNSGWKIESRYKHMTNTKFVVKVKRGDTNAPMYVQRVDQLIRLQF